MKFEQLSDRYDLVVIGGGINGAGIARDAAGRGLKVLLCEQHDLASHTSAASTKLIHGGLRYLEHFEFRFVRRALIEREVLLKAAPHIMWPMRFVVPHDAHLRPVWLIRLGLFLYDHLAHRERLPASRYVNLRRHPAGRVLGEGFHQGFEYSDGWVDDARLVVLNCMDAQERGAHVLTRTQCIVAERQEELWVVHLQAASGERVEVKARALINAAGPWVSDFLSGRVTGESPMRPRHAIRLVKGSHIVVPKLFDHGYAYLFQNPDKRIMFALPFENDFTVIGTTDVEYQGDPAKCQITTEEITYLCEMASRYFAKPVRAGDVVWSYSGVRPLLEDAQSEAASVTRDYTLELDTQGPPLLSVFGGKITTYRRLAERALHSVQALLCNEAPDWTATATLPGGDIPRQDFAAFEQEQAARYPWLPPALLRRYLRTYGTRIWRVVTTAQSLDDLGEQLFLGVYERELAYLVEHEWARCAQDVLWRRSKLGLQLPPQAAEQIDAWIAAHYPHLHTQEEVH